MMMFSLPLAALAAALLAPTTVSAHGYVSSVGVGGKNYTGWLPFTDPYESPVPKRIVRKVPDDGPVMDPTTADIACNKGGESGAGLVATAEAGSKVTFQWTNWPADHMGPVSTYMTSCDGDCTKFDASSAKWFKVDAAGLANGKWAATQLIENGNRWFSTIPSELKPGQYLMRNEIVALHSAGEPQYYPSCSQITVTGSGTQYPSGDALVSIPGLYNNVKFPDIWDDSLKSYTAPGPAVAFSGSSNDSGSESSTSSTESSESSTSASATHASSTHASGSSTRVSTTVAATETSADAQSTTAVATSSAASSSSTSRCSSKRRRRMVKRHVSHLAKRQH